MEVLQNPTICRAWAITHKRNGRGDPAYLLMLENTGCETRSTWINVGDPVLKQLQQLVDMNKLTWDKQCQFKPTFGFKPELEIVFSGKIIRQINTIRKPLVDIIINELVAYATELGLMPHKKVFLDTIIREEVVKPNTPNVERAKERIAAMGKPRDVVKIVEKPKQPEPRPVASTEVDKPVLVTPKSHPVKNYERNMLEFEYHCLLARYGKLSESQRARVSAIRDQLGLCKFKQPKPEPLPMAA